MTGFSPQVRAIITERSDRYCEVCGKERGTQIHHRRPRGRGGSRRVSTNQPSNGLHVCNRCHDVIEGRRPEVRAYDFGWLVHQTEEPREVPVLYRGSLVILDDLGGLEDYPGAGMVTA